MALNNGQFEKYASFTKAAVCMYKNRGPLVTVVTKLFSLAPDVGGSTVLNWRCVTLLASGNLRWPPGFRKFVHPCFKVHIMGRDSSVGIATRYGLDGLGTESRWGGGARIPHPSRSVSGPTHPPIQWVPGLCRRKSDGDVALTTHPQLAPRLKKE